MGAVTVLALASTAVQPMVGRLRDAGRVDTRRGAPAGLAAVAVGVLLVAVAPSPATVYGSALLVVSVSGWRHRSRSPTWRRQPPPIAWAAPWGPPKLGREVGDAGGPLLVGAVAVAASLPVALGPGAVTAGTAAVSATALRPAPAADGASPPTGF